MSKQAFETLNAFLSGFNPVIELFVIEHDADRRMTESWGRGEQYVIY